MPGRRDEHIEHLTAIRAAARRLEDLMEALVSTVDAIAGRPEVQARLEVPPGQDHTRAPASMIPPAGPPPRG